MAESPAHRFGQLIGELLESVIRPQLEEFCDSQGLYLDYQKKDRPARSGKKVSWLDQYGNEHDLDFVIERDGTDSQIGNPVAFIESAWRRYTKHSRNKAQEIQGAILPLAEKYRWNNPFLGTVLAGEFTEGSLDQLRSLGFQVLHFPYTSLVMAFNAEGISIEFDESTPDVEFSRTTSLIEKMPPEKMAKICEHLISANRVAIDKYFTALRLRLGRHITRIIVIPLYGKANEFATIDAALKYLHSYRVSEGSLEFRKYDIRVEFSNGDKADALIEDKDKVEKFLKFVAKQ
jgi:hypothetical protein